MASDNDVEFKLFRRRVNLRHTYGRAWAMPDRIKKRQRMAVCHDQFIEWLSTPLATQTNT